MKYKVFTLVALIIAFWGMSSLEVSAEEIKPLDIQVESTPSETFLSTNRRSIAVETDVAQARVLSSPAQSLNQGAHVLFNGGGWEDPFLPGGNGWEEGPGGNVGMADLPLGDASLPILASMLVLYFLYRGVSSSKRKSNF